jgi:hypothetical protein
MFPFGKPQPEVPLSALDALRKAHYGLSALPETINVPAAGGRAEIPAKPITEATLDDVAFSMRALDAEFSEVCDKVSALRKLYTLARDAGAVGAERAVDAAAAGKPES